MGTKQHPGDFDCYTNAEPDEPLFVLLARDPIAPGVILEWAHRREQRMRDAAEAGEGTAAEVLIEMDQISEARACAHQMEKWRSENR